SPSTKVTSADSRLPIVCHTGSWSAWPQWPPLNGFFDCNKSYTPDILFSIRLYASKAFRTQSRRGQEDLSAEAAGILRRCCQGYRCGEDCSRPVRPARLCPQGDRS